MKYDDVVPSILLCTSCHDQHQWPGTTSDVGNVAIVFFVLHDYTLHILSHIIMFMICSECLTYAPVE